MGLVYKIQPRTQLVILKSLKVGVVTSVKNKREQEGNPWSCNFISPTFSTYLGVKEISQHTDNQIMTKDIF